MSKQGESSSDLPTKPLQRDLLHFFSSSSRYVKLIHMLACIVADSPVTEQMHVLSLADTFVAIKLVNLL